MVVPSLRKSGLRVPSDLASFDIFGGRHGSLRSGGFDKGLSDRSPPLASSLERGAPRVPDPTAKSRALRAGKD